MQWDPVVDDPLVTGYDVHYGLESGQYLWVKDADIDGAATDTQIVDNLTVGDTYCFVVRSHNDDRTLFSAFSNEVCALVESSNTTTSDTVPPTVAISTTPTGPTYTSAQTVTISAAASDDVGVTRVEFYDGAVLKGADTGAPYSYGWAISSADNGSHSWTAKAYDAAGNVATSAALIRTVDIATESPTEPVAAYGFEETEGTVVLDASGNGNDGLLVGATRTTAGRYGSAVSFDGVDDWIDLNTLDISGGGGLSISAWMKADDFDVYDGRLISKATGVNENDHYWMLSTFENNSLRFRLKAGGSTTTLISSDGVIAAGQWHHVAATYDELQMRIYVDGVEVGTMAKTGVVDTNASVPVAIGRQPQGDKAFDGLIDEVRLYNRSLTKAEIEADMAAQVVVAPSDTLAADFTASAQSGAAPFTVTFSDASAGEVTEWSWDFGDGGASTGQTAVYTYSNAGIYTVSLTVTGPAGSSTETKTDYITVTAAPVADFSASTTSGDAPLTVDFTDASSGTIATWTWDFGDGSAPRTDQNPQHTYSDPGIYTVSLTVSGPDGTDSETKLGYINVSTGSGDDVGDTLLYPLLEVGEVDVDYQWKWVAFEKIFDEPPVVIAKPLSAYDDTPATVRIRNISSTGFEIRVQEWDYLADTHGYETVYYLAMEPGTAQLDDGTRIEANRFDTHATTYWEAVNFAQPFNVTPVVLAAVTTENGTNAVTSRLSEIDINKFHVRMYEQEANRKSHEFETISYIAWEPSAGTLDGVPFEVRVTPDAVTDEPYAISYQSAFSALPRFLSDIQTNNGGDTVVPRCRENSISGVTIWLQEEQSRDLEMDHTNEVVGYMSFGQ